MRYETPREFGMGVSKGSLPCSPCPVGTDHDVPHRGPSIEKVRLVSAREMVSKPRLTINLSPYEEGLRMGQWCDATANPYPPMTTASREWSDGWADA